MIYGETLGVNIYSDLPYGIEVDGAIYALEGEPPLASGSIRIGPPQ